MFIEFLCRQGITSENFTIVQRSILLLNNERVLSMVTNDKHCIDSLVPSLIQAYNSQFSESTKKMCYNLLVTLDKAFPFFDKFSSLVQLRDYYKQRDLQDQQQEQEKQQRMLTKKSGLCFLDFGLGEVLGEGSYARVRRALRIDPSVEQRYWEEYAIKIMDKSLLEEQKYMANALLEMEILQSLEHPNMVGCISYFEDDKRFFLVLEYAAKGDVHSLIEKLGSVDVFWAKYVIGSLISVLDYVHSQGYVHLDIKPEVVMKELNSF